MKNKITIYLSRPSADENLLEQEHYDASGKSLEVILHEHFLPSDPYIKEKFLQWFEGSLLPQRAAGQIISYLMIHYPDKQADLIPAIAEWANNALSGHGWAKAWTSYMGDYSPENKSSHLDVMIRIFNVYIDEIDRRDRLVATLPQLQGQNPWEIDAGGVQWVKDEATYNAKEFFISERNFLTDALDSEDIFPAEAWRLFCADWQWFAGKNNIHEAVEFILYCTDGINDSLASRRDFRRIVNNFISTK